MMLPYEVKQTGGDGHQEGEDSYLGAEQLPNTRPHHQGPKEPAGARVSPGGCQTAHPPVGRGKLHQAVPTEVVA